MQERLDDITGKYLSEQLKTELKSLLAPFSDTAPAGESLVDSSVYSQIRIAREEEDASLPLGSWERELKRADWGAVSRLCVQALTSQSKDLQLALWLLEAEIQRQGFKALGPCINLIALLCEAYWPHLLPQDLEHRDNLFRWMADKLRLPLRKVPFTATGSGVDFGWADWEQAQRNEQIRAALGKGSEQSIEGTTLQMFTSALSCTPSPQLITVQSEIADALAALEALKKVLEAALSDEAPVFDVLEDLLKDISLMIETEARKRGLSREAAPPDVDVAELFAESASGGVEVPVVSTADRRHLYNTLSSMADQLARIEPHSPVPYLIRRAVAWGGLNTAQLYNEVFVRCGGQINIFELLGLEDQIAAQQEATT